MLVMRLSRFGRKKVPFYRIVVADRRKSAKGRFIDQIGRYHPGLNPPDLFVDSRKAKEWLKQGVQPSQTVWNLLVQAKVLKEKIITNSQKPKKQKTQTPSTPKPDTSASAEAPSSETVTANSAPNQNGNLAE